MRESNPTTTQQPSFNVGFFLAIGGTALFALKSIFIKLAYAQGVDTATFLMLRMTLAAPFYVLMLGWLWRQAGIPLLKTRDWLAMIGLGFIGYYLSSWLDMLGLNYVSAQLERLTLYTYPIMTTLLGWFLLRERISARVMAALVLTYSGVLVLYLHEATLGGRSVTLGVALVFAAALLFAFYVVFSKRLIAQIGSRWFTSVAMLSSAAFVSLHFFSVHSVSALNVTPLTVGYALLLAIFSTVLPSFMLSAAIGRIGVGRTSIVGTIGPIITILLAIMLLGEPFGWFHLAGVVLVMLGVSLLGKP